MANPERVSRMKHVPNPEHVAKLKEGVEAWNWWREEHPEVRPELSGAILRGLELSGLNLNGADLIGADLSWVDLHDSSLTSSSLKRANLRVADLRWADLRGADLRWAHLGGADLRGADLSRANLQWAFLSNANLSMAILNFADLRTSKPLHYDQYLVGLLSARLLKTIMPKWCVKWAQLNRLDVEEEEDHIVVTNASPIETPHLIANSSLLRVIVNVGDAPDLEIAHLLADLSILYRKMGGSGITFNLRGAQMLKGEDEQV